MNTLNTLNHVKIWFNKNDPNAPFNGIVNELRLVRHQTNNPQGSLTVVIWKKLMSKEIGLEKLNTFQKKYPKITFLDLDDLENEINDTEKELLKIAKNELTEKHGNAAPASDIVRFLRPVIKRGIYTDFDVEVNFSQVEKEIPIKEYLLEGDTVNICNNFMAFPDPNHKIISLVQSTLIKAYEKEEIWKKRAELQQEMEQAFCLECVIIKATLMMYLFDSFEALLYFRLQLYSTFPLKLGDHLKEAFVSAMLHITNYDVNCMDLIYQIELYKKPEDLDKGILKAVEKVTESLINFYNDFSKSKSEILQEEIKKLAKERYKQDIIDLTGPQMLRKVVKEYHQNSEFYLLPSNYAEYCINKIPLGKWVKFNYDNAWLTKGYQKLQIECFKYKRVVRFIESRWKSKKK